MEFIDSKTYIHNLYAFKIIIKNNYYYIKNYIPQLPVDLWCYEQYRQYSSAYIYCVKIIKNLFELLLSIMNNHWTATKFDCIFCVCLRYAIVWWQLRSFLSPHKIQIFLHTNWIEWQGVSE